ncbi:MAG: carboxylating nicotinate-nucleotide diphosphorylase [Planctomycetes bacterium]|nr:carboxylating nicotinate-nucleotide diphosphorylase [Planctomycetota bacterium]
MQIKFDPDQINEIVQLALKEDIGRGDITSRIFVPEGSQTEGTFVAGESGIVAGLPVAGHIISQIDKDVLFTANIKDGDRIEKGTKIADIKGSAISILTAERLVLNFLQRLSGVATMTRAFVERTRGYPARIMDTRKTTPGLRYLERYAVRMGGGHNHRMGLYDQILLKDNHLNIIETTQGVVQSGGAHGNGSVSHISRLVQKAREVTENKVLIEVEVEDIGSIKPVMEAGVDIIMLDNMGPSEIVKSIKMIKAYEDDNKASMTRRTLIEASGNISLDNVEAYAETGIDRISVGKITHSANALDISLDFS